MKTLVGFFKDEEEARTAVRALQNENLTNISMKLVTHTDKAEFDGLKKTFGAEQGQFFIDRMKDGSSLLIVEADEHKLGHASEILRGHGMRFDNGKKVEHEHREVK